MPFSENIRNFFEGRKTRALPEISRFSYARLLVEEGTASMKNMWLTSWLAAFLVPLFLILDHLVYPEYFSTFLSLRIACVISILVLLYFSKRRWAKRYYRLFAVLLPFIIASYISVMMYHVKDPGTPYYAGLTLCLVGVGALLNWTHREAVLTTCFILVMYLGACVPHFQSGIDSKVIGYFINNLLFIIATGILVISGSYVHHGGRLREFLTRMQFRNNQSELVRINSELEDTLSVLQETESQLIQSDKMSFLGQMSAGVIHEIGNPLNFSNQALFLLRKKMKRAGLADDTLEILDDMQEGFDRIKDIISEMREFSHSGAGQGKEFQLVEAVDSGLNILGPQIELAATKVTVNVDPNLKVHGIKNQITQVVVNLVHNAIQAMASMDVNSSSTIEIKGINSVDNYISLTIADSGPGILSEDRSKLFDPFYTTKDPGEGTGLGLSVCYRIIDSHGGTIRVDCPPEGGAVFTLMLPVSFSSVNELHYI